MVYEYISLFQREGYDIILKFVIQSRSRKVHFFLIFNRNPERNGHKILRDNIFEQSVIPIPQH